MSASNYLELALLNHVYGKTTAYTAPVTLYAALFTVAPTDGSGGTEVTGGSYARVAVTNNTTNFPAAAGGSSSNGTAITFPQPTGTWGTVVGWAWFDAATVGNMLNFGNLSTPRLINASSTPPKFAIGALVVTCD